MISFGLLLLLTAFLLNTALALALETEAAYDQRFEAFQTAEVNFLIPAAMEQQALLQKVKILPGVQVAETHRAILTSAVVREFAGSDFDMNTVFYCLEDPRTLNLLDVSQDTLQHDAVYIPLYMQKLGGFSLGNGITYAIDGKDNSYVVGGTVTEMQYGNYGTGLIGAYLGADAFECLEDAHEAQTVTEYSLKAEEGADLSGLKAAVTKLLKKECIPLLSIQDRDTVRQARTMVSTILILIFLSLAGILLGICIFISNFRIRSTIQQELCQMGVLKAIGYTGPLIILSAAVPYILTAVLAAVLGCGLSCLLLPSIADFLAFQSGFSYEAAFSPAAFCGTVLTESVCVALFSLLSAGRIRKLKPIHAIRGQAGQGTAGQTILLFILSFGTMILISFAGMLYYNVSVKPDHLMNTLTEENPSVIFTPEDGKLPDLQNALEKDDRISLVLPYSVGSLSYEDGNFTAFVCNDFRKVQNDICYSGRNPQTAEEIAIGSALQKTCAMGDTIAVSLGDQTETYVVTGYIQSVNHGGQVCELTREGYARLGGEIRSLYVYLKEPGAESLIRDYEEDPLVKNSVNYEQLSENGRVLYANVLSSVAVILILLSGIMVLLVLYVVIRSFIGRRTREFGIRKAMGYTTRQLTSQVALDFLPILASAAFLSAVCSLWYLPRIFNGIFLSLGAFKNHFEVSLSLLLGLTVGFTACAFLLSMLLAAPIRKITPCSLLRD